MACGLIIRSSGPHFGSGKSTRFKSFLPVETNAFIERDSSGRLKNVKFVVTGATGLIGGATARHLKDAGHEVLAVDIKDGEVGAGIQLKVGDLTDLDFCDSVIAGADYVAHLGAIPNPTDSRQFNVFKNNSGFSLK